MGRKNRVVDRVTSPAGVDLEDRRSFGPPVRFEQVDVDLHLRTVDGRWSLHRRRTADGPIGRSSCWDLIDNADPQPQLRSMGTPHLALALGRARVHIREQR